MSKQMTTNNPRFYPNPIKKKYIYPIFGVFVLAGIFLLPNFEWYVAILYWLSAVVVSLVFLLSVFIDLIDKKMNFDYRYSPVYLASRGIFVDQMRTSPTSGSPYGYYFKVNSKERLKGFTKAKYLMLKFMAPPFEDGHQIPHGYLAVDPSMDVTPSYARYLLANELINVDKKTRQLVKEKKVKKLSNETHPLTEYMFWAGRVNDTQTYERILTFYEAQYAPEKLWWLKNCGEDWVNYIDMPTSWVQELFH